MRKMVIASALAALAAGWVGAAVAEPPPPPPPPRPPFADVDANKDGLVTRAEWAASADKMFDAMDRDHSGFLTPPDRPGEGKGERREIVIERRTERDGRGGREVREEREESEGPHGMGRHHPPMEFGLIMIAAHEEADVNHDGKLSKDEFRAMQLRFFDAADVNGDGKIKFDPPHWDHGRPPEPPMPPAPPPPPR